VTRIIPEKFILRDPDDATREAAFDTLFQVPVTIDGPHHEVHEGDAFAVEYADDTMADTDTITLAFKTPNTTTRIHLTIEFSVLVGGHVELHEDATWTTNTGTLRTIYNRKRLASMTSSVLLEDKTATPTFTATDAVLYNPTSPSGTIIHTVYAWGLKSRPTMSSREIEEWILKPNTAYAVILTADGNSNAAQLILDWYEHTDK